MIGGEWKVSWILGERIDKIRELMLQINIHISHIFRKANQQADFRENIAIE